MVEWSFDTRDSVAARKARIDFANLMNAFFGTQADVATAELVLGELIGNVVRYAPGPALVKAEFDRDGVTIAVVDRGRGFTVRDAPPTDVLRESGRGLAIISQLTDSLEVRCLEDDGCCVSARLAVAAPDH
jgi:anti-sigma regulatory factor (Ser/Thr protein kinase)